MKTEIEQIVDLKKRLDAIQPQTAFIGNASSALSAARDNLQHQVESEAQQAKAAAKAKGKADTAKAAPAKLDAASAGVK